MSAPSPKAESIFAVPLVRLLQQARELGLYGAASVAALLTDMGLLALLTRVAHLHYLAASTTSFIAGGVVLYVLSITLVFDVRRPRNRAFELSVFLALGLAGLLVNVGVIYLAIEAGHLQLMTAKILAAGCSFCTNYILRRQFLVAPVATAAQPESP
jgi:putative flippase GtrA